MTITGPMQTRMPTAVAIKRLLRSRLGGQWNVGDRLPPVKELARLLGTGQSNTHHAVRQLVVEGLLESRQCRGTYVVRTPERERFAAPDGQRGVLAGRIVTIFAAASPQGFVRTMIDAFSDVMSSAGVMIQIKNLPETTHLDETPPVLSCDGEAMVLFNPHLKFTLDRSSDQILTVVTTVPRIAFENQQRYDMVSVDELHGGALAGNILRQAGCREACFVGRGVLPEYRSRPDATSALRLFGFESTWSRNIASQHVLLGKGYSPWAGGKIFKRYHELGNDRPDGIFAACDELAVGFMSAAAAHGLVPGKDFQIVGFDGQNIGQNTDDMSLTTVKVPAAEMGRRAAELLIERFAEPDRPAHRLQLECTMHRGATTRA